MVLQRLLQAAELHLQALHELARLVRCRVELPIRLAEAREFGPRGGELPVRGPQLGGQLGHADIQRVFTVREGPDLVRKLGTPLVCGINLCERTEGEGAVYLR